MSLEENSFPLNFVCILLARIEIGSVFESEGPTECKIINVLGSNSVFAISSWLNFISQFLICKIFLKIKWEKAYKTPTTVFGI